MTVNEALDIISAYCNGKIIEVVRCKDCKRRDKEIVPDGAWKGYVFCKKD